MVVKNRGGDLPDLYTLKEAAGFVNVLNEYKIRRLIKKVIIKAYKVGGRVYVTREAVLRAVYGEDWCKAE